MADGSGNVTRGITFDGTINWPLLLALVLGVIVPMMTYMVSEARSDAIVSAKLDRVSELIVETNDNTRRLNQIDTKLAEMNARGLANRRLLEESLKE